MSGRGVVDGIPIEPPPPDTFIDARLYLSPEVYAREMRDVIPRTWFFVGDLDQVEHPGDFVTEQIGTEPVLIVRGEDGRLRALSNVCPHRASLVAKEPHGNCGRKLVCPYHGWSFRTDGTLRGVAGKSDMIGPVDDERLGLREFRLDVWERFIFVNISGDAPPLHEYLEGIPELLSRHGIMRQHRGPAVDDLVDANWKVFVDNALDDYHIPIVHSESLQPMHKGRTFREDLGERWTAWVMSPLNEFGMSLFQTNLELVGETATAAYAISVFPNLTLLSFPDGGVTTMQWLPINPSRTRIRVQTYSHYSADEVDPVAMERLVQMIQSEDYAICESVQQGLQSQFYRPGPLHYLEQRTHRFQTQLMQMLNDTRPQSTGTPA